MRVGEWLESRPRHREYITEQERLAVSDNRDEAHSGEITQWVAWPRNYANSINPI